MKSIEVLSLCCILVLAAAQGSVEDQNALEIELNGPVEYVYCDSPQSAEEEELCNKCPSRNSQKTADCPVDDGYYFQKSVHQCFKWFGDKMSQPDAARLCKEKGMKLAHPRAPVELRKEMVSRYAQGYFFAEAWVDLEYNGANFIWGDDSSILANNSPYWWQGPSPPKCPEDPEERECVALIINLHHVEKTPGVYYNNKCSYNQRYYHPLCELELQ